MNPVKLSYEECDLEQLFGVTDRETQTSNTHIPRELPTIPFVSTAHEDQDLEKGSIKVFEFTQIVQAPDSPKSIKIIRESLTEEIHGHENNVLSDDGTSNRYRYCKEVIKPHLETFPNSQATLVREALESANEEYPDCMDRNAGQNVNNSGKEIKITSPIKKSSKTEVNSKSAIGKVDALCSPMESNATVDQKRSKSGKEDKSTKSSNQEKKPKCTKKDSKIDKKESGTKLKSPVPKDPCKIDERESGTKLKCPVPKEPCQTDEKKPGTVIITKRSSTKSADIAKSSSSRKDSASGIIPSSNPDEKPSFYESSTNESSSAESIDSQDRSKPFINQETISTIKTAVEGFFTKVYRTTHEAVNLITSESAKQLERIRKTDSSNTSASQRTNEEGSGVANFNFFRKIEGQPKDSTTGSSESSIESLPHDLFGKIADKVDSALSMISDTYNESVPDIFKFKDYGDKSSSYDQPQPPKRVSHVITTPPQLPSNNMFMAIKSRICSMFCEGGECKETLSLNQSIRASTDCSSVSTTEDDSLQTSDDEEDKSISDKVSD